MIQFLLVVSNISAVFSIDPYMNIARHMAVLTIYHMEEISIKETSFYFRFIGTASTVHYSSYPNAISIPLILLHFVRLIF